jgi:hypothetical protein
MTFHPVEDVADVFPLALSPALSATDDAAAEPATAAA